MDLCRRGKEKARLAIFLVHLAFKPDRQEDREARGWKRILKCDREETSTVNLIDPKFEFESFSLKS